MNLSICTGTLNRLHLLPALLANTLYADSRVELVLVDGGSTDGTLPFLRAIHHPRLKLVEYGKRSSYPHYQSLAIKNATHEYVAQWNDDLLLVSGWDTVFNYIGSGYDALVFFWKHDDLYSWADKDWICYCDWKNEMCMNYGVYKKRVFREIGLYNPMFKSCCSDGEMLFRAWQFDFGITTCPTVKVVAPKGEKKLWSPKHLQEDCDLYAKMKAMYRKHKIPAYIERLE